MHASLTIVEGSYLRDILDQPAATERTLELLANGAGRTATVQQMLRENSIERIVLTGMGSSFHALHPINIRLNRAGFSTQMVETSELLGYYPESLGSRTLTVAVSQSGESAEIVRLLRDRLAVGPVIGVTNTASSTLALKSSLAILTAAGLESTVSCKTYLATLQALHWLGSAIVGEAPGRILEVLADAQRGIGHYLADWRDHADWFTTQLADIRQIFITGRGWSLATAGTGGLILKESVRYSAEGMSSAAFRHGPLEMLSRRVLTCICLGDPRTAALNRRLHSDASEAGGQSFLLSNDSAIAALRLPATVPELLPLVEILPIQMMSLALGALLGEEPGRFALASKITSIE